MDLCLHPLYAKTIEKRSVKGLNNSSATLVTIYVRTYVCIKVCYNLHTYSFSPFLGTAGKKREEKLPFMVAALKSRFFRYPDPMGEALVVLSLKGNIDVPGT